MTVLPCLDIMEGSIVEFVLVPNLLWSDEALRWRFFETSLLRCAIFLGLVYRLGIETFLFNIRNLIITRLIKQK